MTDNEVLVAMVFDGWAWHEPRFEKVGRSALSMHEARELLQAQSSPPSSPTGDRNDGRRARGSSGL
jgi:hypothetical protein